MLKSKIVVDLPSAETQRRMGPVEWVRSVFGAKLDLRSGKEELTVGALSLVDGMIAAFTRAGITNAISFIVDKKVVYLDSNDVDEDLPLVGKAAQESGILDRKFREMHLALSHEGSGLHTIVDVRIKNQVLLGEEEMELVLSSRLISLRIQSGETAEEYAERIRTFAVNPAGLEPHRHTLDNLTQRLGDALRATMVGAKVRVEPAIVEIIRPDAQQISRFRGLGFGENVSDPTYRPVPTMQRQGAYADPFYYYYYDPYYDFMNYVLVSSMIHDMSWHHSNVYVVDPGGSLLYTGSDAHSHAHDAWAGNDAVAFNQSGGLDVDHSIPDAGGGGSSWGEVDGGGGGDVGGSSCSSDASDGGGSSCSSDTGGSSCSSGSSCGSSCGGSSCGSSCGGGGD